MSVHFSSATDLHATPQDFFDRQNAIHRFTLDVCATKENAKCAKCSGTRSTAPPFLRLS